MTQETTAVDTSNEQSLAAMSDADFLNTVAAQPTADTPNTEQAEETPETKEVESVNTETSVDETAAIPEEQSEGATTETKATPEESNQDESKAPAEEVDHKGFYETLTKPFKANGREIQITKPEDMISLMQKGLNYVKNMTELKPLKQLNSLITQHGITQEDLGLLIELKQKKPEAIAKIVKDSGVDVYGLDVDEAESYVPTTPQVPQINEALEATLEDLKSTSPVFNQTIQIVGNQWDDVSRAKVAEHPQLLRILDAQIASGVYAKIDSVVQYEKALGRLAGLTDLEAYVEVERRLQPAGSQPVPVATPSVEPVVTPKQQQVNQQRKSAAPPRVVKETVANQPINSPALSDDEFLKQLSSQGLR